MVRDYVDYLAAKQSPEAAEHVISLLTRRRQLRLLPNILRMLEHRARKDSTKEALIVAQNTDVAEAVKLSGASTNVKVITDQSVLAGYVYKTRTKLVDMSGRRALINLYQRAVERTS